MSSDPALDGDYGDVLDILAGAAPVEPSGQLAARAEALATDDPVGAKAVQAAFADDGYALLVQLLGDEDLAREALERAMLSVQRELEQRSEPSLSWPEFLGFVAEAGGEARRLQRKASAGRRDGTLDMLSSEDHLYALLCGGLGLSDPELSKVFPELGDAGARRADVAGRLADSLPTPAHESGGEWRAKLACDALGLAAPGLPQHLTTCALCSVRSERLREELDVPLLRLPDPSAIAKSVADRHAKDREHRAAVLQVQAKVSVNCTYCHASMTRRETAFCATCLAAHHEDCFREHGRCAAPGCTETVAVQPGAPAAQPVQPEALPPRTSPWRRWSGLAGGLLFAGVTVAALTSYQGDIDTLQRRQSELLDEQQRLLDQAAQQDRLLREKAREELEAVRRQKQLEIDALRERVALADDRLLETSRKHDHERRLLEQEREQEREEKRLAEEELDQLRDERRAFTQRGEAERRKMREELYAAMQQKLDAKGFPGMVDEMQREFSAHRFGRELDAAFARIQVLSQRRQTEQLVAEIQSLRQLLASLEGGSDVVRRTIAKWQKKLEPFGNLEELLGVELYTREVESHLAAMQAARGADDHAVVRTRFAELLSVVSELNGREGVEHAKAAQALYVRAREAAVAAGAVVGKVDAIDLKRGTLEVGEQSYTLSSTITGRVNKLTSSQRTLLFLRPGHGVVLFFMNGVHNLPVVAVYPDRAPEPPLRIVRGYVETLRIAPRPSGGRVVRAGLRSYVELKTDLGLLRFDLPLRLLDDPIQRVNLESLREGTEAELSIRGERITKVLNVTLARKTELVRFSKLERAGGNLFLSTLSQKVYRLSSDPKLVKTAKALSAGDKIKLLVLDGVVVGLLKGW